MLKKKKTYSRPKRPFDKARIEEEAKIKKRYGLKNKKEIWKAEAKIHSMREKAKNLISAEPEEQKALFSRLNKIGIKVNSIPDILALDKKDYLEQRLETILVKKMLARSMKSARQLITHKKVLVDGRVVNSPSYIVPLGLREKISLKVSKKKVKKEEKIAESTSDSEEKVVDEKSEDNVEQIAQKDKKITDKKISSEASENKIETAPAEDQVEKEQADEKTEKEIEEDVKENA